MRFRAAALVVLSAGFLSGADVSARPGPAGPDIYVARVDGSQARNLTDTHDADSPVVSPDGRKVAFVRGAPPSIDIWVMNADGSAETQKTGGQDTERDPAWGADSRALAFTFVEPGCGSGPARCARPPWIRVLGWTARDVRRRGAGARFSPDGRLLAFGEPGGIATLSRANAAYRRVLRGSAADPEWSPTGRRLAFERIVGARAYVAVMNANGTRMRRLARGEDPSWSKRGLIAFVRGGDIFVVRPDGRGLRRLTRGAAVDSRPVWSPDGSRLAFLRQAGQDPRHLYVIAASGAGGLVQLSQQSGGVTEAAPSWSPDGRSLYYAARLPILPL